MAETATPIIHTETVPVTVNDGTKMPAYVAHPVGPGTRKGLLVFQEAFGVNAHIRDVTERFARQGYTCIAPALFHRTDPRFEGSYTDFAATGPHMKALTEAGLTADIFAAYDWLSSASGGQAGPIGAVGYCLGGRVAFLANATVPIKASASYYGAGIAPGLLGKAALMHGPALLCWGGKDTHITPDLTRAVDDALKAADKPYASITFSQADHGFFCDARASYHAASAHEAWALTLAFFAEHVRP